jgi:hypothetical protein
MKAEERADILSKAIESCLSLLQENDLSDPIFKTNIRDILEEALFKAEQENKPKGGYDVTFSTDGVPTCQVLRQEMTAFYKEHPEKYPVPMYTEFLRYWSEPNMKGVPRWHTERYKPRGRFHLPGRLATWAKNYRPPKVEAKPFENKADVPDYIKMKVL